MNLRTIFSIFLLFSVSIGQTGQAGIKRPPCRDFIGTAAAWVDTKISGKMLDEAVNHLYRFLVPKIETRKSLPLIAGCSRDEKTIYIAVDSHFYLNGSKREINRFIVLHIAYETAIRRTYGISTESATELATWAERAAVENAGIPWGKYRDFILEQIQNKNGSRAQVPSDLLQNDYFSKKVLSKEGLMDALEELTSKVASRVDESYDIPYLAGYSLDGKEIYLHRGMKYKLLRLRGKTYDIRKTVVLHEAGEKALMDHWGLNYPHAHQITSRVEKAAVQAWGLQWSRYDQYLQELISKAWGRVSKIPPELDMTPYCDENDFDTVQAMVRSAPSLCQQNQVKELLGGEGCL